jgi:hypothetical protein
MANFIGIHMLNDIIDSGVQATEPDQEQVDS